MCKRYHTVRIERWPWRRLAQVAALLISLSIATVVSADNGSLSVFLLRDGAPVEGAEIVVDERTIYSDADGFGRLPLPSGKHVVQLYISAPDANLAFVKHPFAIVDNADTRIIVSMDASNELRKLDLTEPTETKPISEQDDGESNQPTGSGSLSGRLLSAIDGQPVTDARVFLQGSAIEQRSDDDGRFIIALPANTPSTISIIHADHSSETINELLVAASETITRSITLQPAGTELEEFVVLAPNLEGEIEATIEEQRNASAVAEVLGAEQFSKQGDSDAANALKRSTGLTLQDGRFVFVRGLGDRYSTSQLNGLTMPSPEPTKRVVPLDMFPTSMVESIRVQKGWSADLPANFGGGNIDIRTRAAPDEFFAKVRLSTKIAPGITYNSLQTSRTFGGDRFGFDTIRQLSDSTLSRVDVDQQITLANSPQVAADLLKTPLGVQTATALPGLGVSASFGDARFDNPAIPEKRRKLAWFGAYSYSSGTSESDRIDRTPEFIEQGELALVSAARPSETSKYSFEHGGLLGISYDVGLRHKFSFTSFFINLADNQLSVSNFRREAADRIRYSSAWLQRSLWLSQVEGSSTLPKYNGAEVRWSLQTGNASANEPLSPSYQLSLDDGEAEWDLLNRKVNFQNNELDDDLIAFKADLRYPFKVLSDAFSSASTGIALSRKDREARSRRFSVLYQGNPAFSEDELQGAVDTLTVDDVVRVNLTSDADESYNASHDIAALYGKVNLFPSEVLELELGVRLENSTQRAKAAEADAPTTVLNSDSVLPQFNLTYQLNEQMQIRGGISQTVTRPDFREFSTSRFQDPETGDITFGNPFLTFSELTHYDLRFEWYLTDSDNLTLGAFAKNIKNPIETILWRTDVDPLFTFLNANSAELSGVEVGWYRQLGHYSNNWRNWTLSGNLALTDSTIRIGDLAGRIDEATGNVINNQLADRDRSLQGQSPYVLNFTASYESRQTTTSIVYNHIGPRIISLGTRFDPDLVEYPARQLDIVSGWNFDNGLKLSAKLSNLLNQEVIWRQDEAVVRSFRKGRTLSLSLKYDF